MPELKNICGFLSVIKKENNSFIVNLFKLSKIISLGEQSKAPASICNCINVIL